MDKYDSIVESGAPDHAVIDRELQSLNGLLDRPITSRGLKEWVRDVTIREGILGNTLWGSIQWRKSIGHPVSVPFANAFAIERTAWQKELKYENGAVHDVTILAPLGAPTKWDGPHDEEHYRVSFLASSLPLPTRVQVSLAPGVAWTRPSPGLIGFREVDPPARGFTPGTGWLVLEPFEVVRKAWAIDR